MNLEVKHLNSFLKIFKKSPLDSVKSGPHLLGYSWSLLSSHYVLG